LLSEFDEVLGFDITDYDKLQKEVSIKLDELPENVRNLLQKREQYRKEKDWQKADEARKEIKQLGYEIKDIKDGILIEKILN
jgi:cysteinyl-tRNA synthetase